MILSIPLTALQQKFVCDNLGLAYRAAYQRVRYDHGTLTIEELISAALLGLCRAARRYREDLTIDPRNRRWTVYAMRAAFDAMRTDIENFHTIHVPNRFHRAECANDKGHDDARRVMSMKRSHIADDLADKRQGEYGPCGGPERRWHSARR